MEYKIENKKLYIAKKLLEYWNNRPDSIFFIDPTNYGKRIHPDPKGLYYQDLELINSKEEPLFQIKGTPHVSHQTELYELMSIKTELLPQLLPNLRKKEIHEGLLSLDEQGIIEYRTLEETPLENYEEIKFFNVRINKPKLNRFIIIANSGLFGFNLSDKDFYNEVIKVLETLIHSDAPSLKLTDFISKRASDILGSIANYSDTILIGMKKNEAYGDSAEDEWGHSFFVEPEYLPDVIYIKDREGLRSALTYIKKTVNDFYVSANLYLEKNKVLDYGCADCGYFIGKCKTVTDIITWLEIFLNGGGYKCKRCGKRSIFSIGSNGEIGYSIVNK